MNILSMCIGLAAFALPHSGKSDVTVPLHADDYILVKFDSDAIAAKFNSTRNTEKSSVISQLNLPEGCDITESKFATLMRKKNKERTTAANPINLDRFVRVTVPDGMTVESLCKLFNVRDDVEYAEPDGIGTGGLVPNDTNFGSQWYHNNPANMGGSVSADIQSTSVWEITTGYTNVILAVLDSGLVSNNIDFVGRVVPGYNFVSNNGNWADDHNHGSMVAGCAAAKGNNTSLVAGINWKCQIMPVKVLNSGNGGSYADFTDGIDFAVSNGANVICFSIGGGSHSTTLSNAIMNAIAENVIFVTITHNDGSSAVRFPGRMKQCITVCATETNDVWASFSNYGPASDLCAPGRNITSINKSGNINNGWYGTSFSCPLVAGVAAMICGIRPGITQYEMEAILCSSADDQVGDVKDVPGWDPYHGWGRLDAYNAIVMAMSDIDFKNDGVGNFTMRWDSPPNASNREPFSVQAASAITGVWTTVATSNDFTYSSSQTTWNVNGLVNSNVALRVLTRSR